MLPEEPRHLIFLLGDPHIDPRIMDVIGSSGVANDRVFPLVQTAYKADTYRAFACSSLNEIVFFVVERIEKRPRDRFDYRCLAGTVFACDRRGTAPEIEHRRSVGFDVLKLDSRDM